MELGSKLRNLTTGDWQVLGGYVISMAVFYYMKLI
ncbi:MAG: hypothetical protein JWP81_2480 [Ferruginibacter sp.]|nr:hypothetical protein [Ferruginibacter sp.]